MTALEVVNDIVTLRRLPWFRCNNLFAKKRLLKWA
jgi:hypothetical protein